MGRNITRKTAMKKQGGRGSRFTKKGKQSIRSGGTTKLQGLRALTLRGPELAMAILGKQKRIENRSWPCPKDLVGKWFALHVGAGATPGWIRDHVQKAWRVDKAPASMRHWRPGDKNSQLLPPRCAIVGLVRVRGVHRISRAEKSSNKWALGPLGWELDRVVRVDPPIRNVTGSLGLWKVQKQVSSGQMTRLNRILKAVQRRS